MDRNIIADEIQELRRQFQEDREGALDAFAARYGDPIRRVVRRMLRSDGTPQAGSGHPHGLRGRNPAGTSHESAVSIIAREIAAALLTTTPVHRRNTPAGETICGRKFPTIG